MQEWETREDRRIDARTEYAHIMRHDAPEPFGAYIETGVIGFVFGEMWRRGVLTPRDRRLITLVCVGASDAPIPIETHVYAALASGDLTYAEYDEFVLHFATQLGWPKGSAMSTQGMMAMFKIVEERGEDLEAHDFELWTEPTDDETRRARGAAAYREVHGAEPDDAITAFRGRSYLDFLYGEIWTRAQHLSRRDRRVISICCAAAAGVVEEIDSHVGSALDSDDLTFEELQELVVHYAVYMGWLPGRQLDDRLVEAARARDLA